MLVSGEQVAAGSWQALEPEATATATTTSELDAKAVGKRRGRRRAAGAERAASRGRRASGGTGGSSSEIRREAEEEEAECRLDLERRLGPVRARAMSPPGDGRRADDGDNEEHHKEGDLGADKEDRERSPWSASSWSGAQRSMERRSSSKSKPLPFSQTSHSQLRSANALNGRRLLVLGALGQCLAALALSSLISRSEQVALGGGGDCLGCQMSNSNMSNDQVERLRRHLTAAWDGAKLARAPDCNRLLAFWLLISAQYPALSAHLLEWVNRNELEPKGQGLEPELEWSRSRPVSRLIGRYLDEAERMLASSKSAAGSRHQTGWLARVSSNPNYATLIQRLRAANLRAPGQRPQVAVTGGQQRRPPEANSNQQQQRQPDQEQHVYGRLVLYPHELSGFEGPERTLDKLRQLSQQGRQLQQHQHRATGDNEIDRLANTTPAPTGNSASELDLLDSNKIPSLAAGERSPPANWARKLGESGKLAETTHRSC